METKIYLNNGSADIMLDDLEISFFDNDYTIATDGLYVDAYKVNLK